MFFGRVVEQGAFATGLFHLNPISPRQGLDMGCPLIDPSGAVRGVVWATLGLEWTADFVAAGNLPAGAVLLVLDGDGTVLMRSIEPEQWVGRQMYRSDVFERIRQNRTELVTVAGVDGVERLFAIAWITNDGPGVLAAAAIGIPTRTASAAAWSSLSSNLAILLAGALACLGLTWFAADRFFLRETRALLGTARALKAATSPPERGFRRGPVNSATWRALWTRAWRPSRGNSGSPAKSRWGSCPSACPRPRAARTSTCTPSSNPPGRWAATSSRSPPRRRRPHRRRVGLDAGQGRPGGAVHGRGGHRPPHPRHDMADTRQRS